MRHLVRYVLLLMGLVVAGLAWGCVAEPAAAPRTEPCAESFVVLLDSTATADDVIPAIVEAGFAQIVQA
jgi:hypothetical protein